MIVVNINFGWLEPSRISNDVAELVRSKVEQC